MKVSFVKSWFEATNRKPDLIEKVSKKGSKYTTEGFSKIRFIAISSPDYDDKKDKYVYHCVDQEKGLEYGNIKVPNKVDCRLGTILEFNNFTGGLVGNYSWFSADAVKIVPRRHA